MSVRFTLLGPDGRVRAVCELGPSGLERPATGPHAAAAARLLGDLSRSRPVRGRTACVAQRWVPSGRIII